MENNFAEIIIKDFRAIKSADIKLNGITVVAGINGSGKSTLSKFLYNCFYYANHYEDLVLEFHKNEFNTCNDLMKQLALYLKENSFCQLLDYALLKNDINNFLYLSQKLQLVFVNHLQKLKQSSLDNDIERIYKIMNKGDLERLLKIFEDGLVANLTIENMVNECVEKIKSLADKINKTVVNRDVELYRNKLSNVYPDFSIIDLDAKEFGTSFITFDTIPLPYSVKDLFYIDSPIIQGKSENEYWHCLFDALAQNSSNQFLDIKSIYEFVTGPDIMNGYSYYDDFSQSFKFKTSDGEYILQECATGIQAFAIIQMLLKNGRLTKSTLLVIDEPEVHLHPQWIVEYARLIVLLHKQLGVKFFIASHNPDLVSAIKYISEKEEVIEKVDYYFAQKDSESKKYDFVHCGKDIEPIFNSFNMSYDKLRDYAN